MGIHNWCPQQLSEHINRLFPREDQFNFCSEEMKINFQFVTVLSAGINIAVANCNTNDLTQPDHFKAWNCVQPTPISGIVPYGTKCYLECEDGYTPFSPRAKNHYTCRKSGWRPPSLDLECKYDRK